jgi:hypothetical protein
MSRFFSFFHKHKSAIFCGLILFCGVLVGHEVFAQSDTFGLGRVQEGVALGSEDIRITAAKIIRAALGLLGVVVLGLMLYGGFTWMTSAGNEEKIATAKKILINATIGLAVILSSFAITQFVISRLSAATGSGAGAENTDTIPPASSCDTSSASYDSSRCDIFCRAHPGDAICETRTFRVRSITPSIVDAGDATLMNNVRPKVLLSRPLSQHIVNGTSEEKNTLVSLTRDGTPVAARVEVFERGQEVVLTPLESDGRLPVGEYTITVNTAAVRDVSGTALEVSQAYPARAVFRINEPSLAEENIAPEVRLFSLNRDATSPVVRAYLNAPLTVSAVVADRRAADTPKRGGNAVVSVKIYEGDSVNPGAELATLFAAPAVSYGSSADFTVNLSHVLSQGVFRSGVRYTVALRVEDIGSAADTITRSIRLYAASCGNGILDPGEGPQPDEGGDCSVQDGASCTADSECRSYSACVSGVCQPVPVITGVSAWDGAAGNWITVAGKNFGTPLGRVYMGVDVNTNGTVELAEWQEVSVVSCGTESSWHNEWFIFSIPNDKMLPVGSKAAIRVVTADNKEDTTIDGRGTFAIPAASPGYFTKNTVRRPGLCRVVTDSNSNQGVGNTPVSALGSGFRNDSSVYFGGFVSPTDVSSETLLATRVPRGLAPGQVGVTVRQDGLESNGVPFVILSGDDAAVPRITTVDPGIATYGSMVSILGSGFGVSGDTSVVVVHTDSGIAALCAGLSPAERTDKGCFTLPFTPPDIPAQCGNVWQDALVIVRVPNGIPEGSYAVVLRNAQGRTTDGTARLTIREGVALPGVCRIAPMSGSAPLPSTGTGTTLDLYGVNLLGTTNVRFFGKNSIPTNTETWLSAVYTSNLATLSDRSQNQLLQSVSEERVVVKIPETAAGYSIPVGSSPVVVQKPNVQSNSVLYTVGDCRAGSPSPGPLYRCCSVGGDAGLWKGQGFQCSGELPSGGYVWRFSTGIFPRVPVVMEECNSNLTSMPSPTPAAFHTEGNGTRACVNQHVGVRFSLPMDSSTLTNQQVKLFVCNSGEPTVDCTRKTEIKLNGAGDLSYTEGDSGSALVVLHNQVGSPRLTADTWYRVEIGTGVLSYDRRMVAGEEKIFRTPLKATRECGRDTAYCFTFRTNKQGASCDIVGGRMEPSSLTVRTLGPLTTVIGNPLYYLLYGVGAEACTMLPVDGLGWQWSPRVEADTWYPYAQTTLASRAGAYTDSRATGETKQETPVGNPAKIAATLPVSAQRSVSIIASSTLSVVLPNPEITTFYPTCTEACVNTEIGAVFNRQMMTGTFAGNIRIRACLNSSCTDAQLSQDLAFTFVETSSRMVRVVPAVSLLPDTWYRVDFSSGIRAVDRITSNGTLIAGDHLSQTSKIFKTKKDGAVCIATSAAVRPVSYLTRVVGARQDYTVQAKGAPDQCSAVGQQLNPLAYDWDWESQDSGVASVTNIKRAGSTPSFCSASCLPLGSDIATTSLTLSATAESSEELYDLVSAAAESFPVCGNGDVDAGEDCDIAVQGESVGVSCSETCLRPGNTISGGQEVSGVCGNGVVENIKGEECDGGQGCSAVCTRTGSSAVFSGDLGVPYCGNGTVDAGEECDGGQGCSSVCLHTGTSLAQEYCDTASVKPPACAHALSVCGNGAIERGEECEPVLDGAQNRCSAQCLWLSICDKNYKQCDADSEGCTDRCTFAGSSFEYTAPSLCGDGIVGTGEAQLCEASVITNRDTDFGGIWQIATAEGNGTVDPATQAQRTSITARAIRHMAGTQVQEIAGTVQGTGSYTLQCGYTEFDVPIVSSGVAQYTDCPTAAHSVGSNSCCYSRVRRVAEYPVNGAGFGQADAACRNTAIAVHFPRYIDSSTVSGKTVILAEQRSGACDNPSDAITAKLAEVFTTAPVTVPAQNAQTHASVWHRILAWVLDLFSVSSARANAFFGSTQTWCASRVGFTTAVSRYSSVDGASSTVHISLTEPLAPNTTYAVVLVGGKHGVRDTRGVSIQSAEYTEKVNDGWIFRTGADICKIGAVSVSPVEHLYREPQVGQDFIAQAHAENGQDITRIAGVYDWDWVWAPGANALFTIPPVNQPVNTLVSKDIEGDLTAVVRAVVSEDAVGRGGDTVGTSFDSTLRLTARFCAHLWPDAAETWSPFADSRYHFSFDYCADAGNPTVRTDDLPVLRDPVVISKGAAVADHIVSTRTCLGGEKNGLSCTADVDCADRASISTQTTQTGNSLVTGQNSVGSSGATVCQKISTTKKGYCSRSKTLCNKSSECVSGSEVCTLFSTQFCAVNGTMITPKISCVVDADCTPVKNGAICGRGFTVMTCASGENKGVIVQQKTIALRRILLYLRKSSPVVLQIRLFRG